MKPECELCRKGEPQELSSILGREMTGDLLYKLFNPDAPSPEKNAESHMLEDLIRQCREQCMEEGLDAEVENQLWRWVRNHDSRWLREYVMQRKAKEKAWQQLLEKIKKGEVQPSDLQAEQLIQHFLNQILEELSKEGWIELKPQKDWPYQNVLALYPEFTEKSEKIIARKVLEEVFLNLKKYQNKGPHEMEEAGWGCMPSATLREFDEFQHTYDMLDVQETLICTAIRDPVGMRISEDDLKIRVPLHEVKSSNALLVDVSYSMRGSKFRGGIAAALAFREMLQRDYREDKLHVVAYNQRPQLLSYGQIVRLRPYGYTDIGQVIDFAAELLSKEEGNKNIFLITDGEPTAACHSNETPEESALRAAYMAGKSDIRLNIIILDRRPELRRFCEKMARLNGTSSITYVDDPLNLKDFIIKFFVQFKRVGQQVVGGRRW